MSSSFTLLKMDSPSKNYSPTLRLHPISTDIQGNQNRSIRRRCNPHSIPPQPTLQSTGLDSSGRTTVMAVVKFVIAVVIVVMCNFDHGGLLPLLVSYR
jgi:hypothetical protein